MTELTVFEGPWAPQVHLAARGWNGELFDPVVPDLGHLASMKPDWGFWTSSDLGEGRTHWLGYLEHAKIDHHVDRDTFFV